MAGRQEALVKIIVGQTATALFHDVHLA